MKKNFLKKKVCILALSVLAAAGVLAYWMLLNEGDVEEIDDETALSLLGFNLDSVRIAKDLENKILIECLGTQGNENIDFSEFDQIQNEEMLWNAVKKKYGYRYVRTDTLFVISSKLMDLLVNVELVGVGHDTEGQNCVVEKNDIKELADLSKINIVNWSSLCLPNYSLFGNLVTGEKIFLGYLVCAHEDEVEFYRSDLRTCDGSESVSIKFLDFIRQKGKCNNAVNRRGAIR
ncbi:MAG: hypothetical protein HUK20_04475 [Fibrobacter sp.]|nr:hypothetical protein [Fibrobacter sp.]